MITEMTGSPGPGAAPVRLGSFAISSLWLAMGRRVGNRRPRDFRSISQQQVDLAAAREASALEPAIDHLRRITSRESAGSPKYVRISFRPSTLVKKPDKSNARR